MESLRISLISYLNSRPFVYGLQHSELWNTQQFTFDFPAESAQKVILKQADIGIIPIATLPLVPNGQIIGNYCISAENEVFTVALFSNHPIEEAQTVYLDLHSKTSVALTRLLSPVLFKRTPKFVHGLPDLSLTHTHQTEAECYLLIGDKVFEHGADFKYKTDLAQQWRNETGMPFVFAAWICNRPVSEEWISKFDQALSIGVNHIDQVCIAIREEYPGIPIQTYLSKYIQFELTPEKRNSISYFLKLTGV